MLCIMRRTDIFCSVFHTAQALPTRSRIPMPAAEVRRSSTQRLSLTIRGSEVAMLTHLVVAFCNIYRRKTPTPWNDKLTY